MKEQVVLKRPRVNALFENALKNQVVLVTAGEGCGKTRAVHSFLSERDDNVVWIPLSERDNDPSHFWETVISAKRRYNTRAGRILEEIGFPETPGQIDRYYQFLAEDEPRGKKHVIVTDDGHLIREEAVLSFARRILSFPFPGKNFILISRAEPDLNTMCLFSKGLLSRITADELRFNVEEIRALFREKKISLTRGEAEEIYRDTEGWARAVNLVAEEMKRAGKKYSPALWESGSLGRKAGELLASVSAPLRRFLIILSLFEQWPLEVLEKITESLPEKIPAGEKLSPHKNHLSSVIWYDCYIHGFRMHRAFLDYLKGKQSELSGEEINTACSISAKWCEENNLNIDAAINYGIAGNYEELSRIIYSFPRLMSRQAAASLLEILDRILNAGGRNEENETFLFLRYVTRAGMLINMGRYDEARAALTESILRYEKSPPCFLSSRILSAAYNSLGFLTLVVCRKTKDAGMLPKYFERGNYYYMRHPYRASGPATKVSLGAYVNPVGHPPLEGEFESLIGVFAQCIPHASYSMNGYLSGVDSLCRAELAFFKGDLCAAEQNAWKAVFEAREKGQYEVESRSLFYLHRIHICGGNMEAGRETWEQMEAQLDIPDYINRHAIYDIMAGWFNAHIGEPEKIASWLRNESGENDHNLLFHNFETMVKAKSLFAEKKYGKVLEFLGKKEVMEGPGSFHLGMLEISVLEAAARRRAGDEDGALETLGAAYEMSAANSLCMPFIELGEDMRILAGLALNSRKRGAPKEWLETIRNRASVYAKRITALAEHYPRAPGADELPVLTPQELSILSDISRGYTREEISRERSISINTVKAGIKSIYDKLGAINRADAIRIATGLGILKNKNPRRGAAPPIR